MHAPQLKKWTAIIDHHCVIGRLACNPDMNLVNASISLGDIRTSPGAFAAAVVDAGWFFLAWQKDPTVQSCLAMLDAIHQTFHSERDLDAGLVDEQQPRTTFHFLELTDFGLSDDLYIKMNENDHRCRREEFWIAF